MIIKTNSLLYRWAYILDSPCYRPSQTTLCSFFWRAFVWVPFTLTVMGFVVAMMIVVVITDPWIPLYMVGVVVAIVALAFGVAWAVGSFIPAIQHSLFIQGIKSIKSRFCPLIRFED